MSVSKSQAAASAKPGNAPVKTGGIHVIEALLGPNERTQPQKVRPANKLYAVGAAAKVGFKKAKMRTRHMVLAVSLFLCVLVPGALATFYMFAIAQDKYHSSASFAVRSIDSASASDLLGMFTQSSSASTASDSYIVMDFIRSEQMVRMVDKEFNLDSIYALRGLDYVFSLRKNAPIEEKLSFWNSVTEVNFDHTSGILEFEVRAFDRMQAQKITAFVVAASERLVNDLSAKARNGVLEAAHREVVISETRLSKARAALRDYRDREQEVDPIEGAKMAAQLIGALELQLVQLNSDLSTARSQMSEDTPRIRVLTARIASIEDQLRAERERVGSGSLQAGTDIRGDRSGDVANRIQAYEILETEREFGEKSYAASLVSLEKARMDANSRQRYLAVFIEPTVSDWPQYPSRFLTSFLICAGLFFLWSVGVMGYYNIRDRT
jgi:capsular polysaccharide transport system permease protein